MGSGLIAAMWTVLWWNVIAIRSVCTGDAFEPSDIKKFLNIERIYKDVRSLKKIKRAKCSAKTTAACQLSFKNQYV